MILAYIAFIFSVSLVGAANARLNRSKAVKYTFSGLAVTIVAMLAGARNLDATGGTDLLVYGNLTFDQASGLDSISEAVRYRSELDGGIEFGYFWLNFVVSRISDDPHVFYFVLSLLTSGFVMVAILVVDQPNVSLLMWATYLSTFYFESFNLLRQSLAMSIMLLGLALSLTRRKKTGLLIGLCAIAFHQSAIIFIVLWAICMYLLHARDHFLRHSLVIFAATITVSIFSSWLLTLAQGFLAGSKYGDYLAEGAREGAGFDWTSLHRLLPILAGIVVITHVWRKLNPEAINLSRNNTHNGLTSKSKTVDSLVLNGSEAGVVSLNFRTLLILVMFLIIELCLLPIRSISYPLYRVPMYFGYTKILGYGVIAAMAGNWRVPLTAAFLVWDVLYFQFLVVGTVGYGYYSDLLNQLLGW